MSEPASPFRTAPFRTTKSGVSVALRVAPGARHNRINGVAREADGTVRLKVGVTAKAEGGKANKAVIALLAKTWRLPKTSLTLTAGAASRRKTVLVAGEAAALLPRLRAATGPRETVDG